MQDADRYTDSFALVYPLQLVSFSPRPDFAARAIQETCRRSGRSALLVDAFPLVKKGRPAEC
jgi:hypothetical protein